MYKVIYKTAYGVSNVAKGLNNKKNIKTRMWVNAQSDGRPAE